MYVIRLKTPYDNVYHWLNNHPNSFWWHTIYPNDEMLRTGCLKVVYEALSIAVAAVSTKHTVAIVRVPDSVVLYSTSGKNEGSATVTQVAMMKAFLSKCHAEGLLL